MKILSRDSSAAKERSRKEGKGGRVQRRIEITVEREIVSVLVRGQQGTGTVEQALERQTPEPPPLDLQKPN